MKNKKTFQYKFFDPEIYVKFITYWHFMAFWHCYMMKRQTFIEGSGSIFEMSCYFYLPSWRRFLTTRVCDENSNRYLAC